MKINTQKLDEVISLLSSEIHKEAWSEIKKMAKIINNTQKKPEILGCPFCGSKPELKIMTTTSYCVDCDNPECSTSCSTMWFESQEDAIQIWNKRA